MKCELFCSILDMMSTVTKTLHQTPSRTTLPYLQSPHVIPLLISLASFALKIGQYVLYTYAVAYVFLSSHK